MPRRHDDLFGRIATFPALHAAAHQAITGKRRKPGAAAFMAGLETELLQLERELNAGVYRPGRYLAFEVHDPKRRMVSAAPFRDRVVHHALYEVVAPIFEHGFIHDSHANRIGKTSGRPSPSPRPSWSRPWRPVATPMRTPGLTFCGRRSATYRPGSTITVRTIPS
jgi:RNA-directed DNA polymerase